MLRRLRRAAGAGSLPPAAPTARLAAPTNAPAGAGTGPYAGPYAGVNAKRRLLAVAAAGAAGCCLLAACGSGTGATTGAAGGTAGSTAGSSAKAGSSPAKKVPLVLYAAEGYDTAMGKAFQAATGIPVKVDDDSTGPLITKVEAEKNNPQWDLMWCDGATEFAAFDDQGLLLKNWTPPNANYNSLGQSLLPKDKSYIPTGVTMAAALVYNTKTVTNPPTSWSQLLQPQWKGAVGMNDPAVSGPTYPYVAGQFQQLGGTAQGEAYFKALKANGLHVYQTNTNTLQALETGVIKLATIQSSAGIGASLKNTNLKVSYLQPETSLPGVIGIANKISPTAQAEAKQFVEFVMSSKGQQVMQSGDPSGDSLFWPLVSGVNPLPALPPLSSVPAQTIDPYVWGPRENSINTWFTDNIVQ